MEEKLTLEDFVKAKKALEEARIPEPWVLTSSGIRSLKDLETLEEYEKRRLSEGREI